MPTKADHQNVTRTLPLIAAAAIIACGVPLTDRPQAASATGPPATTPTTAAQSKSTLSTTSNTSSTAVDHSAEIDLVELGLPFGVAVDRPQGFPSFNELMAAMAEPFRPIPHSRARIFSGYTTDADPGQLVAARYDPSLLKRRVTITYFDGTTVWDYAGEARAVGTPDGRLLYHAEDGSWQESEMSEWSPLPIPTWPKAQDMVAGLLETDTLVELSYEILAETETVHLEMVESHTEVWLDRDGAVMRMVMDLSKPVQGFSVFMVWNVETLSPELTGPVPDVP